jgi:ribokinase
LGTPVQLVSAIATDSAGYELSDYLIEERVDTAHIEYQPHTISPYTLVLSVDGYYFHAGSRQRREAALSEQFIVRDHVQNAMGKASAVLLTLEPSVEVIGAVIKSLYTAENRPLTILTASPPVEGVISFGAQELGAIDILIGTEWELQKLGSLGGNGEIPIEDAIRSFTELGVRTICVLDRGRCRVFVKGDPKFKTDAPPENHPLGAIADESATSDAFAGTLASRLIAGARDGDPHPTPSEADLEYAWSALLATRAKHGTSPSLPAEADIRRVQALARD